MSAAITAGAARRSIRVAAGVEAELLRELRRGGSVPPRPVQGTVPSATRVRRSLRRRSKGVTGV